MMTLTQDKCVNPYAPAIRNLPMRKMLTSAIPFMALAVPGTAYAQDVSNTASVSAPSGALELDPSDNTATDTDTLLATIVANDDTASGAFGFGGATDVISVLGNDTFNGAGATTGDVTIAVASGSSVPTGLTFDTADGTVDVDPNTAAGTYTFDYTICETGAATNCDTATVTVTVTAPTISADADSVSGIDGVAGDVDVLDVLDGDTIGGAAATPTNVTLTVVTPATPVGGAPVPTLDTTDGLISVPAGTPAGIYTIDYQICDPVNATNCASETATITVVAPTIVADADSATGVDGVAGAADVLNVLDGDTLGGNAATTGNVTIAVASGSSVPAGLTFDTSDGSVSVDPGTAAGTYTFDYTICDAVNPTNCDTNTVSVTVDAPAIVADPDTVTGINGADGGTDVVNVLDGDTIGGAPATTSNVTITVASGSSVPTGLTFDTTDGGVSVDPGTPAGTYTFDYTICDTLNPTNCATNTVSVTVDAPAIVAVNDTSADINGADGGTDVLNVLSDDTINGVAATTSNVTISVASGSSVPSGLSFDTTDGSIDVAAGTSAGVYTFDYTICDAINPTNCDTATATVNVVAPAITADDDSVSGLNGVAGGTDVLDVLAGDTLNGVQTDETEVTIAVITPATPIGGGNVPTLDTATGQVQLPANTPAGTYTIVYEIEDRNNAGNTAQATATVTVAPSVDLSLTKTNGVTEVRSGDTVTYVLTVSNAGPDAAVGATVTDTPGAGLSCPAGGTITFGGTAPAGAPGGSPTVGDLTSSGIVLGTIGAGENVTITYSCSVN